MKNIRSTINRHIRDLERTRDIGKDGEFRISNEASDGKLKQNVKDGVSRSTKQRKTITRIDLSQISDYLHPKDNPIILCYRVWFDLAIHYVTHGREFHNQFK